MPKINKNLRIKQYKIPLALAVAGLSGIFFFQYLTFIPEYSTAAPISTTDPVTLPKIEGTITTKFGTEAQGYKTYMQEISLSYCQNLPNETTGQLADGRDGKIYWVTVLGTGDAKTCWMTQDLDLDLGSNGPALTTANDGDNLYKGSDTDWGGGGNVASSDSDWTQSLYDNINWYERDKVHGMEHASLGNLYSFEVATAGTGASTTDYGVEVAGSICPAGWKLPVGGNNSDLGSFRSLDMTYDNVKNSPYYFQPGGRINGALASVGISGFYWSATSYSNKNVYYLLFGSGDFNQSSAGRYYGMSVRCVVRDASYVPPVTPSDSGINNPSVSVTVPSIITLDVYSENEDNNTVDIAINNNTGEGNFTAKVSSNSTYNLSLSTTENGHTDLRNDNTNTSIPALSTTPPIITTNDSKWWGIKCIDSVNCIKTEYTGLTTSTVPYFASNTGGSDLITNFTIGIQTSPDLPSGTYSTSILVTASQN